MKKIISIILCAVMLTGIISVCVSAVDRQEVNSGFSITDIEVNEKTATVAIENSEACKLVAAIYDPAEKGGVAFEDLPEDWKCPRCRQGKEKFNKA